MERVTSLLRCKYRAAVVSDAEAMSLHSSSTTNDVCRLTADGTTCSLSRRNQANRHRPRWNQFG
ncbi:hypothetical protein RE6C_03871 [Rhodopirellula europaea 6C]|uniref:Uncharacterized protein n=1 Tax=Rhodopirellula europaea 6C TaxID=1263867 RepID=M2ARQ4_9BACT|nr:hypothetical protein RE6C_03871 [Rhodopirellula europaea 6C]